MLAFRPDNLGALKHGKHQPVCKQRDHDHRSESMTNSSVEYCHHCGNHMGWKQIKVGGRRASRSFSDFKSIDRSTWPDRDGISMSSAQLSVSSASEAAIEDDAPLQEALIERLPFEVLTEIIELLFVDTPSNGYGPRNSDLMACLLTSKRIHAATLTALYRYITVPHSKVFSKLLQQLSSHPVLGALVRRLDFSSFTSIGLGRTRKMNSELQMLTSKSILKCLQLTPHLKELLLQEHVDTDLDEAVLNHIFSGLPHLQGLDFCGCSSSVFRDAAIDVISPFNRSLPQTLSLQRLSLNECSTLPAKIFEVLLPRLPYLTHLDVARTQITDKALWSIPEMARLTHLNLARCNQISGDGVIRFLTMHAAARGSLVYLNLHADISRYRLLLSGHVSDLLPQLPSTLRSLSLNGAQITPAHIPLLLPLTKHLEELGLACADLSIRDINSLFIPKEPDCSSDVEISMDEANWIPSALRYLDLTAIRAVSASTLVSASFLLRPVTEPLEVIELGEKVLKEFKDRPGTGNRLGWAVRELGRRGWYVRTVSSQAGTEGTIIDDGAREWKMGAKWWGMRKIPVASTPAAGLYVHYMFKI